MAGRPFGRFEVLAQLAAGGTANIFMAREPTADGPRLVCLKTLLPERVEDEDFVSMFLDEARLAARFEHDNCVEIIGYGKERDAFYIALEFIFGETLWSLVNSVVDTQRMLPAPVVASIVAAAAEGLHHAHELTDEDGRPYHLVHRDVSPQNVMITYAGRTKVLDFGVAKADTGRAATATGIVKGKFSYMSPEQIVGSAVYRRSDVFSLGIVLHESLCARPLYYGDNPRDVATRIVKSPAPPVSQFRSDVDPELEAICARALERRIELRYPTAGAMAEALSAYLDRIGFDAGERPVAAVLADRFGPQIERRKRACVAAVEGEVSELELLSAFGARPVFDADMFPRPRSAGDPRAATPNQRGGSGLPVLRSSAGWFIDVARARLLSLHGGDADTLALRQPSELATHFEPARSPIEDEETQGVDRAALRGELPTMDAAGGDLDVRALLRALDEDEAVVGDEAEDDGAAKRPPAPRPHSPMPGDASDDTLDTSGGRAKPKLSADTAVRQFLEIDEDEDATAIRVVFPGPPDVDTGSTERVPDAAVPRAPITSVEPPRQRTRPVSPAPMSLRLLGLMFAAGVATGAMLGLGLGWWLWAGR